MSSQASILPAPAPVARYLTFNLRPGASAAGSRELIQRLDVDESICVGIGGPLIDLWGNSVDGLREFPALSGAGVDVPSSQAALWTWLRGDDRGDLVHQGIGVIDALQSCFELEKLVDGFKHGNAELGKDLTGYEDGTENPTGDEAVAAGFVDEDSTLAGSSFVAVQQWIHDLRTFKHFPQDEQDQIIGRRLSDNAEIGDAPESAHVKRTEQESFEPHAIVLRRSMPFAGPDSEGLMFVAFGKSLDAFEVQLRRMAGLEDGIADALFRFSRPVTGSYFWCPPVRDGHLNLDVADSD